MFASVVFVSFFSVLSREIGWEERLRNDLFCVRWDVKTLTQSIMLPVTCIFTGRVRSL